MRRNGRTVPSQAVIRARVTKAQQPPRYLTFDVTVEIIKIIRGSVWLTGVSCSIELCSECYCRLNYSYLAKDHYRCIWLGGDVQRC